MRDDDRVEGASEDPAEGRAGSSQTSGGRAEGSYTEGDHPPGGAPANEAPPAEAGSASESAVPGPAAAAPLSPRTEERTAPDESPPPPAPRRGWLDALAEQPEVPIEIPRRKLITDSRRDFLLISAGALASLAGAWWLLPERTKSRLLPRNAMNRLDTLAARAGLSRERAERVLDRALTFDDDVAEALYSKDRRVRTYDRADVTRQLKNNYHGRTPGPGNLASWALNVTGLASGRDERLAIDDLRGRFAYHDQVTRLVCVEGWSAIAWWGGLRFADFLKAYPPAPGAKWAALRSTMSLDAHGEPETYFVSIDLETARHPQTLLTTHRNHRPLDLAHGAPLRLIAPMKLGLKNIKAITDIAYTAEEPPDYWARLGYSRYDGL